MKTEAQRLSEITHRIGTILGAEMGGRFNVLGNLASEENDGSPTRTLKIVDRWAPDDEDLSCIIEIRKWGGRL
jgi:hypothetical protein